ncbi:MAG: ABC transporter permease [Chloroflexi bacterium]|nr:ABC transporter permease [Chloroflexota bacterium]
MNKAVDTAEAMPQAKPLPMIDKRYIYPVIFFFLFMASWELAIRLFHIPAFILPTPSGIFQKFIATRSFLWEHTSVTVYESVSGFILACIVGVSLAVLVTSSQVVEWTVYPYFVALHTIPIIAIAPLLILWFGFGMLPKVLVSAIISFLPILINTIRGLNAVDYRVLELMDSLSATQWEIFTKIRFPAALPFIFAAFKVSVTTCVIGAVVGEFIGSDTGLGYLIIHATTRIDTELLFVAIAILAALGISLFLLVSLAERYFLSWYEGTTSV